MLNTQLTELGLCKIYTAIENSQQQQCHYWRCQNCVQSDTFLTGTGRFFYVGQPVTYHGRENTRLLCKTQGSSTANTSTLCLSNLEWFDIFCGLYRPIYRLAQHSHVCTVLFNCPSLIISSPQTGRIYRNATNGTHPLSTRRIYWHAFEEEIVNVAFGYLLKVSYQVWSAGYNNTRGV